MFFFKEPLCLTFGVLLLRDSVDATTPILATLFFLIWALFLLECDLVNTVSRFLLLTGHTPILLAVILVVKSSGFFVAPSRLLTDHWNTPWHRIVIRFGANADHAHGG